MKNFVEINRRSRERGYGTFEIALVIVLMGVIAAGSLWVTRSTSGKMEAQSLSEHLDLIIKASVQLSIAAPTYENVSTASLVSSGLLPEKYVSGGAIRNPVGGFTHVAHRDDGLQCGANSCGNVFIVTMTGIRSSETCTILMSFENASRVQRRYAVDVSSGNQAGKDQDYRSVCAMDGEKHFRFSIK